MPTIIRKFLLLVSCSCILFACGGGGGSGSKVNTEGITISGTVSANIVYPGSVRIYGVNSDGTLRSPALAVGDTRSDGSYSLMIGNYQGAIVGMAFGRYTDEASRTVIEIPEENALYSALPASEEIGRNSVILHISPLTEVAYLKARATSNFAESIAGCNDALSQLFGIDVIRTAPVAFDAAAFSNTAITSDQIRLATLLAVISQFTLNASATPSAPTAGDLQAALNALARGITVTGELGRLSQETAYLLQQAVAAMSSNGHTKPIVTAGGIPAQAMLTTLATIGSISGTKTVEIRLRTNGTYSGNIYGITMTVDIPPWLILHTEANGTTKPGVVVASGQAASSTIVNGRQAGSTLTVGLINAFGFPVGEFATVYGEIPLASTAPKPGAFTPVAGVKIVDGNGNAINGIDIETFL